MTCMWILMGFMACSETHLKDDGVQLTQNDTADSSDSSDFVDTGDTSDNTDTGDTTDTDTEDSGNDSGNPDDITTDDDGDGYSESDGDCDDGDDEVSPAADEVPYNGIDDDCDTSTPDDDLDEDGYGYADDCNDDDATVNPGMDDDTCNGIDNNCDSNIDEGWTTEMYEPNDFSPYDLGDLLENQILDVQAYLTPQGDVDQYAFYNEDGNWDIFGFEVYTANVASNVDIGVTIDFIGDDGIQVEVVSEVDDYGPGQNEYIDYNGTFGVDDSGIYIVKVRAITGSDCGLMYTLFMEDP